MKKFLLALVISLGCFASFAEGDWRETCGKIVELGGDTGIAGFVKRLAPAYMTGEFAESERPEKKPLAANRNGYYDKYLAWHGGYFNDVGAFVEGHKVVTLFGMPYGVGQLIMIPVCLILMYLAIVKGFEPLLLLPIGFGGLLLCAILLPSAVPLIGALMLGNLAKEIGASVSRIADTMANALINIVTIMLGLSVGSKLACEKFLSGQTLAILALGLCAFCVGTAGGVLMAKVMNLFSSKKNRINPLIGSAGVSAVPMAARVSNKVALEDDPTNYVLMQAMGPNVSGVIGSAVVAGVLYTLCK